MAVHRTLLWQSLLLIIQVLLAHGASEYGILHTDQVKGSGADQSHDFCILYDSGFQQIPETLQEAAWLHLYDVTPSVLCREEEGSAEMAGKAVAAMRSNCTFTEKAEVVQHHNGKALLIVSNQGVFPFRANQSSDYDRINITVAMIGSTDFSTIQALRGGTLLKLYSPKPPRMDYNLILIWVLAVVTVAIGAYWSGRKKYTQSLKKGRRHRSAQGSEEEAEVEDGDDDQDTLDVSPKIVVIFVILMCGMLLSLYFFYDYLVYVILGLFTLASIAALHSCLLPLISRIPCIGNCRLPENKVPCFSSRPEVRSLLLILPCAGVSIWWFIERHASYSWILQDLLGVAFCVHMMKTIRLPSLKACTILLVMLFFYDIFFVFITPLITKHGESIMVDVATGGSSHSKEQLPMVLKVPRFAHSVLSLCHLPYSLLGFGDILIPGLLVSYCHAFDLRVSSRKVYFIGTLIAYGVGLLITFLALALMEKGQPALLYLVPCTLLTVLLIGLKRGEVGYLWRGEPSKPIKNEDEDAPAPTNENGAAPQNISNVASHDIRPRPLPEGLINEHVADSSSSLDSEAGGERRQLLNR